jgi:hypothetical protein
MKGIAAIPMATEALNTVPAVTPEAAKVARIGAKNEDAPIRARISGMRWAPADPATHVLERGDHVLGYGPRRHRHPAQGGPDLGQLRLGQVLGLDDEREFRGVSGHRSPAGS